MSTTAINFSATLIIGDQPVPLTSEIVIGDGSAKDGVSKGFIFKLNRQPGDPPVIVNLGDVIGFIEQQLGAGSGALANNPNMALITQAFPSLTPAQFNSSNQTLVNIYEFTLNSGTEEFLFSFNLDVQGSDPTIGLIQFPAEFNNWLNIQNISVAFSASSSAPSLVTVSSPSKVL